MWISLQVGAAQPPWTVYIWPHLLRTNFRVFCAVFAFEVVLFRSFGREIGVVEVSPVSFSERKPCVRVVLGMYRRV